MEEYEFVDFLTNKEFTFNIYESKVGLSEIIKISEKINLKNSRNYGFILIIDPKYATSYPELIISYLNAGLSLRNKTNQSKSIAFETLLFFNNENSITAALEKSGVKSEKSFLLFSNITDVEKAFSNNIKLIRNIKTEPLNELEIKKLSKITSSKIV